MILSWWMDIVFLIALAVFIHSLYRMHRESESELDPSLENAKTQSVLGNGPTWIYPAKLIRQAGIIPAKISVFYWVGKLTLAFLLPLLIAEWLGSLSVLTYLTFALLGFGIIDLWLLARRRERRQKIERSLGYVVDLIAAFLKSGMNLGEAFEQAAKYGLPLSNPLAREISLSARELKAGNDRVTAFRTLAERTGVQDVFRLAALMNVGFRVGAPLGDTLEAQAELLRAKQWEQADALVNRRSVEALFPMLLVSLPLIFVLVFFPAAVQIYEIFAEFSGAFS